MTAPLADLMGTPIAQPTVEVEDQDVEISVLVRSISMKRSTA